MAKKAIVINSSTGTGSTTDFTSSGFGAIDGAIFIVTSAASFDSETAGLSRTIAFYDGTTTRQIGAASEDGQGRTDTESNHNDSLVVYSPNGTVDGAGTFSKITDGLRVTWSDTMGSSKLCTVILFGGGVDIHVDHILPAPSLNGTATYSSASFEFDAAIFLTHENNNAPNNAVANTYATIGVCVNDGSLTQRAAGSRDKDKSNSADIATGARNDAIGGSTDLSTYFRTEVTAASATGFTVTTVNGADAKALPFMLIGGLDDFSLDDTPVPSSTGVKSWEGAGFEPELILNIQSAVEAYNTAYDTEDLMQTIGVSDGTTTGSLNIYSEDGAGTSVCKSIASTSVIKSTFTNHDSPVTADFDSFDSLGYNFDYTAIDANAYTDIGFTLALRFVAAAGGWGGSVGGVSSPAKVGGVEPGAVGGV